MQVIERFTIFAADHPQSILPPSPNEPRGKLIADRIGAAAGVNSRLATAAHAAAIAGYGGGGPAQVWLTSRHFSVVGAEMANSATANLFVIDDNHHEAANQTGAGIIPAGLATAPSANAVDDQIFNGLAIGYDVAFQVVSARHALAIRTSNSRRRVNFRSLPRRSSTCFGGIQFFQP